MASKIRKADDGHAAIAPLNVEGDPPVTELDPLADPANIIWSKKAVLALAALSPAVAAARGLFNTQCIIKALLGSRSEGSTFNEDQVGCISAGARRRGVRT